MKIRNWIYTGLTMLLVVPGMSLAAEPGFYVGATAGVYNIEQNTLDEDDSEVLKAFAGFQVNEWFGIEAAWLDFNRTTEAANDFESDGVSAAALLSLPIGEHSSFFVKAGQYWWDVESNLAGIDVSGNDMLWGAGFNFGFNDHLLLRIEYEQYELGDIDIESASAGLQLTF
jgi:OmpA-OmpF porin, OOP family